MITIAAPITKTYKYASTEVAALMIERGSFRLGSLSEYQSLEGSDVRGDLGEGTRVTTSAPGPTTYLDGSHIHQWLRSKGINVQGSIFTSGDNAAVYEQHHPDCFVFCVSQSCSPQLADKFGGACVEIANTPFFFAELDMVFTAHLKSLGVTVRAAVFDQCVYTERRQPYYESHGKHPCFIKPPRFQEEAEWRAVWMVDGGPISPAIVQVPSAIGCLRLVTSVGKS